MNSLLNSESAPKHRMYSDPRLQIDVLLRQIG